LNRQAQGFTSWRQKSSRSPFQDRRIARLASQGPMQSLLILITQVIQLYIWIVIIGAVLSWLIAFNVINTQNRFVYTVVDIIYRVTEPVLAPLRRILPDLGGIDISPVVLLLLLYFVQNLIWELYGSFQAGM
jgi:YggT family protein